MKQQHVTEHTNTQTKLYIYYYCSGNGRASPSLLAEYRPSFVSVYLSRLLERTQDTQTHFIDSLNERNAMCSYFVFIVRIRMFSNSRKLKIMNTLSHTHYVSRWEIMLLFLQVSLECFAFFLFFLIPFPYCTTIDFLSPISNRRKFNALQTCLLFWSDFANRTVDGQFSVPAKGIQRNQHKRKLHNIDWSSPKINGFKTGHSKRGSSIVYRAAQKL